MTATIIQEQNRYKSISRAVAAVSESGAATEALDVAAAEVLPSSETNLLVAVVEALALQNAELAERVSKLERAQAKGKKS